jgi:thioesterase domain-containing protein
VRVSPLDAQRRLHTAIPLSAHLGVRVLSATPAQVRLAAPLAPSINHLQSLFGGSAVAVATLAAWVLLDLKLEQAGSAATVVIQRSSMHHERPVRGDFEALACAPDVDAWSRFMRTFARRGRARCTLSAQLLEDHEHQGQEVKASFEGEFVALSAAPRSAPPAS